jgi:hypothetical protein
MPRSMSQESQAPSRAGKDQKMNSEGMQPSGILILAQCNTVQNSGLQNYMFINLCCLGLLWMDEFFFIRNSHWNLIPVMRH